MRKTYKFRLFYNQLELKDEMTLLEYNIQDQSILLVIRILVIFIETMAGKVVTLDTEPSNTIDRVK
jgi:hypothetical protein